MIYRYPYPENFQNWENPDLNASDRPIVLWGAGKIGGVAAHCLKKKNVKFEAFCDIVAEKWGTQFCGHLVISPDELKRNYPNAVVMISAICYLDIWDALQALGFQDVYDCSFLFMEIDFSDYDFWTSKEYAIRNVEQYLAGILEQKGRCGTVDQIDLHITTKCSLRCRDCSVFVPYTASPKNYDMREILTDLHHVLDGLGHVRVVNFYGGEPLLHPDLASMIHTLREETRVDRISVITNGTIVPNQELLQAMEAEPRFLVRISDYGEISSKVDEIRELLEQHGIQYEITNYTYWDQGTRLQETHEAEEELIKKFKKCTACNILFLHDRKGYVCCVSSAGCTMGVFPDSSTNYIDLTDTRDLADRLNQFLTRPGRGEYLDACRYCSGMHCIHFEQKVPVAVQTKELLTFPKLT